MTVSTISTGLVITATDVLVLAKSKILTASRAAVAVSGDVAYTGAGFQPRTVIAFTNAQGDWSTSFGFADENLAAQDYFIAKSPTGSSDSGVESYLISFYGDVATAGAYQKATLKTLDTDGFTLNWDKSGGGGGGDIRFLCFG